MREPETKQKERLATAKNELGKMRQRSGGKGKSLTLETGAKASQQQVEGNKNSFFGRTGMKRV